jgi:hypothetical protein
VFRRSLILVALAILVAAPAASSPAAPTSAVADNVLAHIRVEGKNHTIFGDTDPRVSASNALDALEHASRSGEFWVHVVDSSFGPYVDQVGLYPAGGHSGWAYKVNGVSPPVGADQYILKPGDDVLWYWATFGPSGGPLTLELHRQRNGCYRVTAEDDQGKASPADDAVLHVNGRSFETGDGVRCLGDHDGLVQATMTGAVRSNEVE